MRVLSFAALAAASLLLAASTATPDAHAAPPALEAYWPHEDGRQWLYDQHYEELFLTGDIVDNVARMFFNGTTTAGGGVACQVLDAEVTGTPLRVRPESEGGAPAVVAAHPFLRQLWLARPDLRAKIERAAVEQPCPANATPNWAPLLLHNGAYRQTATEIGAWRCDVANLQSWLYLTSDLSPGAQAQLQLVPDLADDVFLYVRVDGLTTATVPAGTFNDCLHVEYLIDYGESECTDPLGNPTGTMLSETTGYVRFAPGIGPIESFEEFAMVSTTGTCGGPVDTGPVMRTSLKMNAPSVPALATSWGAVKSIYRQ
jgi:hypothetical protein